MSQQLLLFSGQAADPHVDAAVIISSQAKHVGQTAERRRANGLMRTWRPLSFRVARQDKGGHLPSADVAEAHLYQSYTMAISAFGVMMTSCSSTQPIKLRLNLTELAVANNGTTAFVRPAL